jgi:hypothetical protein
MKIKYVLMLLVASLFMAGSVLAQKPAATKFTSVYTSLSKGCKTLKGGEGQDDAYICRGAGKYQVRVYYSAASSHINAELKGTDESVPLATLSIGFDESKTTLEWRLADGKPFAVIMRQPVYSETVNEGEYYGKVIGQKLVITGLVGFTETITGEVDAKTPNANVKARKIADDAYIAQAK